MFPMRLDGYLANSVLVRCAGKMEDVIFNGTDSAKPLGMAEVTLTLADCNATLELDYDEVSITRRVFRSGESGYFLNEKRAV